MSGKKILAVFIGISLLIFVISIIVFPYLSYRVRGATSYYHSCECLGFERIKKIMPLPDVIGLGSISHYCYGLSHSCDNKDIYRFAMLNNAKFPSQKFSSFLVSGYPYSNLAFIFSILSRILISISPVTLFVIYGYISIKLGKKDLIMFISIMVLYLMMNCLIIFLLFNKASKFTIPEEPIPHPRGLEFDFPVLK